MASIFLNVRDTRSVSTAASNELTFEAVDGFTLDRQYLLGASRDSSSNTVEHQYGDHDICVVDLKDGMQLTLTPEEFSRLQQRLSSTSQRGIKDYVFKTIAFLKPKDSSLVSLTASQIADKTESLIIDSFDAKTEGVYQCQWRKVDIEEGNTEQSSDDRILELSPTAADSSAFSSDPSKPNLLFIHGTFSTTNGSFSGLGSSMHAHIPAQMSQRYGDRMFALEHRTLARNPVQNAITVLQALPKNAVLHIVTHSRGGIVGDLIAASQFNVADESTEAIDVDRATKIFGFRRGSSELAQPELEQIRTLNTLLKQKSPQISSYLRCACPSMGTSILAESEGFWLSGLKNVSKIASIGIPQLAVVAKATDYFAKALAGARALASEIPGLEAMQPSSPLLLLMNTEPRTLKSPLVVISGEAKTGWKAGRIALEVISKLAFDGRSDWVVDTRNMFGGFKRNPENAWYHLDESSEIHHMNYFKQSSSANRIASVIRSFSDRSVQLEELGFSSIEATIRDGSHSDIRAAKKSKAEKLNSPQLFILPGIMGSYLNVTDTLFGRKREERIWIDISSIAIGELRKIQIDQPDVSADGSVRLTYRKIINHFENIYHVHDHAFDWRIPILDASKELAKNLEATLKQQLAGPKKPIYILAHSMGGLVARGVGVVDPSLWQRLHGYEGGFRLLMLGTPNGGSHSIIKALSGHHKLVNFLSWLDFSQSRKQITEMISRFDGLVNLLPNTANQQWFTLPRWQQLQAQASNNKTLTAPDADCLRQTQQLYEALNGVKLNPDGRVSTIYVAGRADKTPIEVEVTDDKTLRFKTTAEGDGAVPWSTGIPDNTPVWYIDEGHGNMTARREYYDAFQELLETGFTSQISKTPPAQYKRSQAYEEVDFDDQTDVHIIPTESDLEGVFGATPRIERKNIQSQVNVKVVHGNLKFVRGILCVGHYQGDTLVGAEWALDQCLDGMLSLSRDLGTYPGAKNTSKYFLKEDTSDGLISCGVVVGLGTVGSLSPGSLKRSFANALVELLEQHGKINPDGNHRMHISTLIIGCGEGGISVRASMESLLKGVMIANEQVRATYIANRDSSFLAPQVASVDFVELYQDTAIEAHHTLIDLTTRSFSLRNHFQADQELGSIGSGWLRAYRKSDYSWWLRMDISGKNNGSSNRSAPRNSLQFRIVTDKSGTAEFSQNYQPQLVESIINQAVSQGNHNQAMSSTLFEVLLPVELKDYSFEDRDLMLVVDECAAPIPWELMDDKDNPDAQPISVRSGLVRQLSDINNQISARYSTEDTITVVGDPTLDHQKGYPQLAGARAEAELVINLFKQAGFNCVASINENSLSVITKVVNTNSKILHLAGHGVHSRINPQSGEHEIVSGLVLDNDCFLNADILAGQRNLPELVFINCCHLGQLQDSGNLMLPEQPHQLAASISRRLINLGVKAVVAAGWAINDDVAVEFANTFYRELLENQSTFGNAVKEARRAAYERNPKDNTWGAYQCYGDPSYQLKTVRPVLTAKPKKSAARRYSFATIYEAIIELKNITSSAQAAGQYSGGTDSAWHSQKIDAIKINVVERGWSTNAEFQSTLGMTYGELGMFKEAIHAIEYALDLCSGDVTQFVRDELAFFKFSHAISDILDAVDSPQNVDLAQAKHYLGEAIDYLRAQIKIRPDHATLHNYLGSALKGEALIASSRSSALRKLKEISKCHQKAADLNKQQQGLLPYEGLLLATADALSFWLNNRPKSMPSKVRRTLAEVEKNIELHACDVNPSFWSQNHQNDLKVARLLARTGTPSRDHVDDYPRYSIAVGSSKQLAAVHDHLRFVQRMLEFSGRNRSTHAKQRLFKIISKIASET